MRTRVTSAILAHYRIVLLIIVAGCTLLAVNQQIAPAHADTTTGFGAIPLAFYARTEWTTILGPGMESLGTLNFAAQGPNGETYFTRGELGHDSANPGVYVLDNGRISCLLCNEARGFRNGPAAVALFDPRGQGGYPGAMDIAVDKSTGVIYLADGYNHRIRKVAKDGNGQWQVSTFAGCGDIIAGPGCTVMQQGQDYVATSVALDVYVAIAVDHAGNLWTATQQGYLIRMTPGGTARIMAQSPHFRDTVDMDIDNAGNIYMIMRASSYIAKYSSAGVASQLTTDNPQTWDGPVAMAGFNEQSYIAVSPDGTAIYVGGGDMNTIRRIRDEGDGNGWVTKTLKSDGTWYSFSVANGYNFSTCYNDNYEVCGWKVGSPRFVDANGDLYIAWSLYVEQPFSRLPVGP
jgi:hypothetical protein